MSIIFSAAQNRTASVANVYSQLTTNLKAAGWEIVYADADAIGTGTATSPKWDKTPAAGVNAGVMVVRMPVVSGFPTRWCVQITPGWASGATSVSVVSLRIATDSTAAGVLTNPGSLHQYTGSGGGNNNTTGTEWYVSAYEHGLLVALYGVVGAGYLFCVDRRRKRDATILDDVNFFAAASQSPQFTVGGVTSLGSGGSQARNVNSGEYAAQKWVVQAASDGTVPYTLNSMDGLTGIPQGPINVSGGTSGVPRLFAFSPTNDAVVGVDTTFTVDGAARAYHTATTTNLLSSTTLHTRICYAKE